MYQGECGLQTDHDEQGFVAYGRWIGQCFMEKLLQGIHSLVVIPCKIPDCQE